MIKLGGVYYIAYTITVCSCDTINKNLAADGVKEINWASFRSLGEPISQVISQEWLEYIM